MNFKIFGAFWFGMVKEKKAGPLNGLLNQRKAEDSHKKDRRGFRRACRDD